MSTKLAQVEAANNGGEIPHGHCGSTSEAIMGHQRAIVKQMRAIVGHPRAIMGHPKAIIEHLRAIVGAPQGH